MATSFGKQYESPLALTRLLQSRGLLLDDVLETERLLKRIGYYRLSADWYPLLQMPKSAHRFKADARFSQALMMYRFDLELRLLIFRQIAKIEVAVRSAIVNIISRETGDIYWMTNAGWFMNAGLFANSMALMDKEFRKSSEDFIVHFRNMYCEPYPPAWMLAEILPLGTLVTIFRNFKSARIKKLVAKEFCLSLPVFDSWLNILTVTRNSCGHHSRVWNKIYSFNARLESRMQRPWVARVHQGRIYFTLCIIKYFVDLVEPGNDMLTKLRWLMVDFPEIDLRAMGFPQGWEMEPLWR